MKILKSFSGVKKLPRELAQIEIWAKKSLESEEVKNFLFNHTNSEMQFDFLMGQLLYLSDLRKHLVTWKYVEE